MEDTLRSWATIIIDADEHKDDLWYLENLYNYVIENKKRYSLNDLKYMIDHLRNLAKELGKRDAKELKELLGI